MKKLRKRKSHSTRKKTTLRKKERHQQKKPFTQAEMNRIDQTLAKQTSLFERTLFRIAIDTMLRSSDLLKLQVQDVVSRKGKVCEDFCLTQQKTGMPVMVTLMSSTQTLLGKFIEQENKGREDFLFVKQEENAIHANYFRRLVKKWAGLAGIENVEDYSGHSTRRSKPMVLYEQGTKIGEICKALGHSSLATTLEYLGIEASEVKATLQKHPIWEQPSASLMLVPPSAPFLMNELSHLFLNPKKGGLAPSLNQALHRQV